MKWITREKVKVDRVACPWLVARFVNREPPLRRSKAALSLTKP
jgi:hypothetical protein